MNQLSELRKLINADLNKKLSRQRKTMPRVQKSRRTMANDPAINSMMSLRQVHGGIFDKPTETQYTKQDLDYLKLADWFK